MINKAIIQMSKQISATLDIIFNAFKEKDNKIDLKNIKNYFDSNKQMRDECDIFIKKLQIKINRVRESRSNSMMTKEQFDAYFNQSLSESEHFNIIFDSIDKDSSGFINKKQLRTLLTKFGLYENEEDVNIMIECCSQDGEKIKKTDLESFLKK